MKIGRNDRCPCGSGLKYKKCCLNGVPARPATPVRRPLAIQAQPNLGSAQPSVVGQVHKVVKQVIEDRQSQEPVKSNEPVKVAWELCPAVQVLQSLADQDTVKATATGNFSRDFCQQQICLLGEHEQGKSVRGEGDLPLLGLFKRCALAAGMIVYEKGRYRVSELGLSLLEDRPQQVVHGMIQAALAQEPSLKAAVWTAIASTALKQDSVLPVSQFVAMVNKVLQDDMVAEEQIIDVYLMSLATLFGLLKVDRGQVAVLPALAAISSL